MGLLSASHWPHWVQHGLGKAAGLGPRGPRKGEAGTVRADGKFMGRSASPLPVIRMALLSSDSFGNLFL